MTAITDEHPVVRVDDEPVQTPRRYLRAVNGTTGILNRARARTLEMLMRRNPWLDDFLKETRAEGRAQGYREGINDALNHITSGEHAIAHPEIPIGFIAALQRGPNLDEPLGDATVYVDGISVTITLTTTGTGVLEPDAKTAWKDLRETVRSVDAAPYCEHTVSPLLPREIALAAWTDTQGRPVSVIPPREPEDQGPSNRT